MGRPHEQLENPSLDSFVLPICVNSSLKKYQRKRDEEAKHLESGQLKLFSNLRGIIIQGLNELNKMDMVTSYDPPPQKKEDTP